MRAKTCGVLIGLVAILAWALPVLAGVSVQAVRLWPTPEYSRITLEFSDTVEYSYFTLKNPHRLVLDLRSVEPAGPLQDVGRQIHPQYPLIANLRAGLNQPGVTRVVAELKGEVVAQVFTLKPMGDYGHRLVVDLYPSGAPTAAPDSTAKQVEKAIAGASPTAYVELAVVKGDADKAARVEKASARGQAAKPEYARLVTVAIDAGHGGEDPGAIGANGSREKDITLSVARRLKEHIDKRENMRAVLTRDGDTFIPLHERVKKARAVQADLFVSIHADAFLKPEARGSSVFALSEKGATSAAARWLAKRENEADLIGGVNIDVKDVYLKQTLIDLSQTATIADSLKLGRFVLDQLGEFNALHKPHVEQAGFAVLKAPDIPSILVETAFISNPEEEKLLLDEEYQEKMAEAIANGIKGYLDRSPPLARTTVVRNF